MTDLMLYIFAAVVSIAIFFFIIRGAVRSDRLVNELQQMNLLLQEISSKLTQQPSKSSAQPIQGVTSNTGDLNDPAVLQKLLGMVPKKD